MLSGLTSLVGGPSGRLATSCEGTTEGQQKDDVCAKKNTCAFQLTSLLGGPSGRLAMACA